MADGLDNHTLYQEVVAAAKKEQKKNEDSYGDEDYVVEAFDHRQTTPITKFDLDKVQNESFSSQSPLSRKDLKISACKESKSEKDVDSPCSVYSCDIVPVKLS